MTPLLILFLLLTSFVHAQPLPRVAPEQVGMDSERLMYADEAINQAIAAGEIPGAVLAVVRHGKMAYLKAYGHRSLTPEAEPMTTATVFDMASCSKAMSTAVCVMILVEQGRLRLLDPVSRYLPGFRDWTSEDGRETQVIRIRDLLTHTSGLPSYANVQELAERHGILNARALMDHIATCPRRFRPQTAFSYSCLNFIALQHVIETVSGESLRQFARRHIFEPLGMAHTDYLPCRRDRKGRWVNTDDVPRWAKADGGRLIAPTERQPDGQVLRGQVHDPLARVMNGGVSGNAGVFSCAEDVALLCAALQNGGEWNGRRILSPAGVQAMRSVPRDGTSFGRTLGWDCFTAYASNNGDLFGHATYSHTGFTGTSIVIDPDTDTSVILLTNAVHPENGPGVVRLRSLVSNVVAASILDDEDTVSRHAHYYRRFLQFMDEPPVTPDDIVMLGNSLTENGGDWSRRLRLPHVLNRGIIGDDAPGVYQRLHQILPGRPRDLFLMIGVNDLSHGLTPDSVAVLVRRVVERIRRESPCTRLHLQSLLPINESFGRYRLLAGKTALVPEVNARLRRLAREQRIDFIDLFPLFTEKGTDTLRRDLTTDGLHLNEKGYNVWSRELKKVMEN